MQAGCSVTTVDPHPVLALAPAEPVAVQLMDTVFADRTGVRDSLASLDDLRRFLAGLRGGAPTGRPTSADLARARALRDALRRLAAEATGDDRPLARTELDEPAALAAVNAALAAGSPPFLRRVDGQWRLVAHRRRTIADVLAELAAEGADLVADPAGPLRACRAPGCVLYFVKDHPRREWCGVTCGNRARAARHYARVRGS
jgi:predicted RNA-binding Zn ribbon-like protein